MEWSEDKSKNERPADERRVHSDRNLLLAPGYRSLQPWQIPPRNGVRFDERKTLFVKFAHSVTQESKKAFNPRELA